MHHTAICCAGCALRWLYAVIAVCVVYCAAFAACCACCAPCWLYAALAVCRARYVPCSLCAVLAACCACCAGCVLRWLCASSIYILCASSLYIYCVQLVTICRAAICFFYIYTVCRKGRFCARIRQKVYTRVQKKSLAHQKTAKTLQLRAVYAVPQPDSDRNCAAV